MYKKEKILEDMKKVAEKLDSPMSCLDYDKHGEYDSNIAYKLFGTWNNAKREAGLKVIGQLKKCEGLSEQEFLQDLQETAEKVDGTLTCKKYRENGNYSSYYSFRYFGGWKNAKKKAGLLELDKTDKELKKDMLFDLKIKAVQVEGSLSCKEYREKGKYTINKIQKIFGSWNNAKKQAGLDISNRGSNPIETSKEEIINDIKKVNEKVDGNLTLRKYRKLSDLPIRHIYNKFVSWENAKIKAEVIQSELEKYEDVIKDLRDGKSLNELEEKYGIKKPKISYIRDKYSKSKEERYKEWSEILKGRRGFYNRKELINIINNNTDLIIKLGKGKESFKYFAEWVNENTDIQLNSHGRNKTRYFLKGKDYNFDEYKKKLPEEYHKFFDKTIGEGKSPKVITASILYFINDGELTQREIANDIGCTTTSIRKTLKKYQEDLEEIRKEIES